MRQPYYHQNHPTSQFADKRIVFEDKVRTLRTLKRWAQGMCLGGAMAFVGAASAADVLLHWNDNSDNEAGFKVERSIAGGAFESIGQTGVNATSYVDAAVERGVAYEYRVYAFNRFGNSGYTNVVAYYRNVAPSVSSVEDVQLGQDQTSLQIPLAISDLESAASDLSLSFTSSNPLLVDAGDIKILGLGGERSLLVTPKWDAHGVAKVTVTVSDGEDSVSTQFTVNVEPFTTPEIQLDYQYASEVAVSGETFALKVALADLSLVESVTYLVEGVEVGVSTTAPFNLDAVLDEAGDYEVTALVKLLDRNTPIAITDTLTVTQGEVDYHLSMDFASVAIDGVDGNGSSRYDAATNQYILTDKSGRIGGTSDSHRFHALQVTGDFTFTARLAHLDRASDLTIPGVMVRDTLNANSIHSSMLHRLGRMVNRNRFTTGGSMQYKFYTTSGYIRVVRKGTSVSYFTSSNGSSWTRIVTNTINLKDKCYVGLVLGAEKEGNGALARFDNVAFEGTIVGEAPSAPNGLGATEL